MQEYEAAVLEFKKNPSYLQASPLNLAAIGHALARAGRAGEAKGVLDHLLDRSARQYASPYGIAVVYAGLRDPEQAIGWLRRSLEDRSYWLPMLAADPRLDPSVTTTASLRSYERSGLRANKWGE